MSLTLADWPTTTLVGVDMADTLNATWDAIRHQEPDVPRAQLNGANLTSARLNGANLASARLTRADLTSADLTSARLADAWLPGVDFTRADLDSANLTGANLAEVTLTDANLRFADLTRADLRFADLTGVNLSGVYLANAVWPPDAAVPEGWQRDSGSGRLARIPSATVKVAGLPGWVDQYLLPAERIVTAVRQHPLVILLPVVLTVVTLVGVLAVTTGGIGGSGLRLALWLLFVVVAARACWRIINWRLTYFVITEDRLMLVNGVYWSISKLARSMPSMERRIIGTLSLAKVTDVKLLDRSPIGRALGYGQLIAESAGQKEALSRLDFVPHPEELFQKIISLLYPRTTGRDKGDPAS